MKKSRKSKIVLLSVLGLATVSLATVGFASWVINYVTPATSNNITAEVGTIEENTLTAAIANTDGIGVRFDNVSGGGNGFTTGDKKVEDLNVDFTATVTGNLEKLSKVEFSFAPNDKFLLLNGSSTTNDNTDDYIVFPFSDSSSKKITLTKGGSYVLTGHANNSSVTTSVEGNVLTLTCNFKFAWGAAFGGKNPGDSQNTTPKADLVTRLKAFNGVFPTTGTLMTVTVTPVAA